MRSAARDGAVELDWADGTHRFRLAWGQLIQLQEACDAGPMVVLSRLQGGTWRLDDIRETVRLGLIGGGMAPEKALSLVRAYVEERPPIESIQLALGILAMAVLGAPEEDDGLGEAPAAQETGTA